LSDGRKKEIYQYIRFFHGALQFILKWMSQLQKYSICIELTASLSLQFSVIISLNLLQSVASLGFKFEVFWWSN